MRTLSLPPHAVVHPQKLVPAFGSYLGPLPRVDLSPLGKGLLYRKTHHKKWVFVTIVAEELVICASIADLGYAINAFAFAYDPHKPSFSKLLAEASVLAPPFAGSVNDTASEGCRAEIQLGRSSMSFHRWVGASEYWLTAKFDSFEIHASLRAQGAPSPICAIAPIAGGLLNATEKRALLPVSGAAIVDGRRVSLDGALAGFDYTNGYLARHTRWRWAYGLGYAQSKERIGFNLTEGFVGDLECVAWVEDEVFPIGEGVFKFDRKNPHLDWEVSSQDQALMLKFRPGALHSEEKNLGLVASRFIQPVGQFSGVLRVANREIILDRILGVTEDQDVKW